MSVRDVIARSIEYKVLFGAPPEEIADTAIRALRADPAAVLSLLPVELLADLLISARFTALAEERYETIRPNGQRALDVLDQAQS